MDISLRRAAVRASALNAIDSVEVIDRFVIVRLFKTVPSLTGTNVRIEGGVRINPVNVLWASRLAALPSMFPHLTDRHLLLVVHTDSAGDFSTYRLRLVDVEGFDPRVSEIDFTFKLDCPPEFDEPAPVQAPPPLGPEPEIDYLAKDYGSFRRLMLDRLSAVAPDWKERNPADLGVALVELLAYVGDQLGYFQDAVATEAYLGTARQRISVRRHARLAGYRLDEGVNARAWVSIELSPDAPGFSLPAGLPLLTRGGASEPALTPESMLQAVSQGATVFETMHEAFVEPSRNEIEIYTWTGSQTVIPAGGTSATLVQQRRPLSAGDLILFEEVVSPRTGEAADADPRHRHVVRLTSARPAVDPLTQATIVEAAWDAADALPFPLVLSAVTDADHGARFLENVSVARGNVVLADHGWTVPDEEDLGTVPADRPFRPLLNQGPLTHARPLPSGYERLPASHLMRADGEAVPALRVRVPSTGEAWLPRQDLVASSRFAPELVAEVREDGRARLRFGNDVNGKAPTVGASFAARYRIGRGIAGNIGADALRYIGIDPGRLPGDTEYQRESLANLLRATIVRVRNPLPGRLGQEPESLDEARRFAPQAFLTRQRAVSESDWAALAGQHPEVQRAAAAFRWTGSWRTVSVSVDRLGGAPVDEGFADRMRRYLDPYLISGYDLEIRGPRLVPLDLALQVCVKTGYFRHQIESAVAARLDNRNLFHPDRWTFGQPVILERIYGAVKEIEGVESVRALRFQRWGRRAAGEIENGVLPIAPLEIAVLDNDPSFRENGRLEIQTGGGR